MNKLQLKESFDDLLSVVENRYEIDINRYLAGLTIKSLANRHKIDIFISNKYIDQLSGDESYCNIKKIIIQNDKYNVNNNFDYSILNDDNFIFKNSSISINDNPNIDVKFSLKNWLLEYRSHLQKNTLIKIKILPQILKYKFKMILKMFLTSKQKYNSSNYLQSINIIPNKYHAINLKSQFQYL